MSPTPPAPFPRSILIIGLGELGTSILSALTSHPSYQSQPHSQRPKLAILRRPDSLAGPPKLHSDDIVLHIETADFATSPLAELVPIFQRYDVVIQAAGFGAPPGTQLRVAEAAARAGVARFLPWQFGVDYDAIAGADDDGRISGEGGLFGEMVRVRELLRAQGRTRWTVLSTGLFMSFLFLPEFGVVDLERRVVRALGGWEERITLTAVEDVGRMVAEVVFVQPEETEDRVVFAAGDTVSYGEIAGIVEETFGFGFKREVWGKDELRGKMDREPENGMVKYQNVFGGGWGILGIRENAESPAGSCLDEY
ncbi:Isoflavone reductase P3 [Madurella mycetomatis]|uniref:Isoflavone reductase P3 n=1 Tax=Madurella mycetomatis TaxID=100816 RepID=A0A175VS22_9PEZI|nr:Isoflavone reductase P3 [Madurella mycetomatis]